MPDYILSNNYKIIHNYYQPPSSRWTAHPLIQVLGCGLPIHFRISIPILPYHESLPVPQTMLPCLFGWNCFKAFPQFEGFAILKIWLGRGSLYLFRSNFSVPSSILWLFIALFDDSNVILFF